MRDYAVIIKRPSTQKGKVNLGLMVRAEVKPDVWQTDSVWEPTKGSICTEPDYEAAREAAQAMYPHLQIIVPALGEPIPERLRLV